jgi:hypothetical protein
VVVMVMFVLVDDIDVAAVVVVAALLPSSLEPNNIRGIMTHPAVLLLCARNRWKSDHRDPADGVSGSIAIKSLRQK